MSSTGKKCSRSGRQKRMVKAIKFLPSGRYLECEPVLVERSEEEIARDRQIANDPDVVALWEFIKEQLPATSITATSVVKNEGVQV